MMLRTHPTDKPAPQWMRRSLLTGLLACGVLVLTPVVVQACAQLISQNVDSSVDGVVDRISSLSEDVSEGFEDLLDVLPKLANQTSNNDQNLMNSYSGMVDHQSASEHASQVAQARVRNAVQMVPSRTTCRILSQQRSYTQSAAAYRTERSSLQSSATNYSLNAPGTPGEKGTLAALTWGYQNRCTKYADAAAMGSPPGCTGASNAAMIDLDIMPHKSIFSAYTYGSSDLRQAALDSVTLLTEPAPGDPVRGDTLSRENGRNIHVMRLRDLSRMNIARDILQDAVALRSPPASPGADGRSISRLSRLIELMTGTPLSNTDHQNATMSTLASNVQDLAKTAAGEPENANVQALAAQMTAQKMMLTEMLRMTEQMIAVAAVNLASDIERSRVGNTGVGARTLVR